MVEPVASGGAVSRLIRCRARDWIAVESLDEVSRTRAGTHRVHRCYRKGVRQWNSIDLWRDAPGTPGLTANPRQAAATGRARGARSMMPPPSTRAPLYSTSDWPGLIAGHRLGEGELHPVGGQP